MNNQQKILGVRRNVFFLGLVSFFNDFSAEMVQSVMPVFLTSGLGAPAFVVGLIEGVADALASVLKLFSGWLSDAIRRRKILAVLGYGLSVLVRPFLSLTTHFSQVLGLRVVDRIGKGFRDAPRDALITESVEKEELGKSFGFHRSLDTVGATVGPLATFLLLPLLHDNYRELFLVSFLVGVGAIVSFVFVKEVKYEKATRTKSPTLNWTLLRSNRKFLLVILSLFVFGLGTLPILLVLLKARGVGFSAEDIPLMYLVYNVTFVVTAVPLGRLADRVGERTVIGGGLLAATAAYFGLSYTGNPLVVVALFVVLGLYSAATDGVERALAAKFLDSSVLATGQGLLNMAIGFSSLVAGVVGGLLWTKVSVAAAFLYAGTFSLVGLALFLLLTSHRHEQV